MSLLVTKGDYEFANRLNSNLHALTEEIHEANKLKEEHLQKQTQLISLLSEFLEKH